MKRICTILIAMTVAAALCACIDINGITDMIDTDDVAGIIGEISEGNGIPAGIEGLLTDLTGLADLTDEQLNQICSSAAENGYEVSVSEDGTAVFTDSEGNQTIMNHNGTWTVNGNDAGLNGIGGEIPANGFTDEYEMPEFGTLTTWSVSRDSFTAVYTSVTEEEATEYINDFKEVYGVSGSVDTVLGVYILEGTDESGNDISIVYSLSMLTVAINK